jgi:hypothetical protein
MDITPDDVMEYIRWASRPDRDDTDPPVVEEWRRRIRAMPPGEDLLVERYYYGEQVEDVIDHIGTVVVG